MNKVDHHLTSYFGEPSIGLWEDASHCIAAFSDSGSVRLDICRKDGRDGITWDELQRIKNDCGFSDKDAVEFYPKQEHVINTGNCRHLYVFDKELPLIRRL